jgi:hypothetical protein
MRRRLRKPNGCVLRWSGSFNCAPAKAGAQAAKPQRCALLDAGLRRGTRMEKAWQTQERDEDRAAT